MQLAYPIIYAPSGAASLALQHGATKIAVPEAKLGSQIMSFAGCIDHCLVKLRTVMPA